MMHVNDPKPRFVQASRVNERSKLTRVNFDPPMRCKPPRRTVLM